MAVMSLPLNFTSPHTTTLRWMRKYWVPSSKSTPLGPCLFQWRTTEPSGHWKHASKLGVFFSQVTENPFWQAAEEPKPFEW